MSNASCRNTTEIPSEMNWVDVCPIETLTPFDGVCALVKGRHIALFRFNDEIHALDNYDPKGGASVLSRGVVGDLNSRRVVASPLYKHHYDLETGSCLEDAEITVPVYPARVMAGIVQIGF